MLAIDWSGRVASERRHLWLAEAAEGRLLRLECGRSRSEVADHLIERSGHDRELVVGFDFSFSLPEWFLDERGYDTAVELWEAAARDGEQWLRECRPPFWGRQGKPRPVLPEHLRRTEATLDAVGGIRPKSTFQIGGAGSVGTGSIRGFPVLARLRKAGFAVWPFDAPAVAPVVVEIYPRALTGVVVKSSAAARHEYLARLRPGLPRSLHDLAVDSEDAFDAAVSAIVMSHHADELLALPPVTDPVLLREGQVWTPG